MKFAVIICGQARTLNRSFLNYLDKENVDYDVFIHYWEPENNGYTDCGNIYAAHTINNLPKNLHEKIIETYKPKKIECEKQIQFKKEDMIKTPTNSTFRTISNLYGCFKGHSIIENKEDYTHFIKIRFDFEFKESFTNIKEIDDNSIYFLRLLSEGSLCDIFWLVPRNKQILFNIYNFIYETDIKLDNISEHITLKFLDYHNLSNNLKKFSAKYTLDRSYIKQNIIICLWGETFRRGCGRLRKSYEEITEKQENNQIKICNTHIKLLKKINENYNIKLIINTYFINDYAKSFISKHYDIFNPIYIFNNNKFKNEREMIRNTNSVILEKLNKNSNNYKGILLFRIDLFLKNYLINNLKISNKILFAHIDIYPTKDIVEAINPNFNAVPYFQICQQIMYYPLNYFYRYKDIFDNSDIHPHTIRNELIKNGININEISYIINTIHICSTSQGWNPLYQHLDRHKNDSYECFKRDFSKPIGHPHSFSFLYKYIYDEKLHKFKEYNMNDIKKIYE